MLPKEIVISKSASAQPPTVLVFADDDDVLYASPAPWRGAASPRDATAPTGNASVSEAFRFTTPA